MSCLFVTKLGFTDLKTSIRFLKLFSNEESNTFLASVADTLKYLTLGRATLTDKTCKIPRSVLAFFSKLSYLKLVDCSFDIEDFPMSSIRVLCIYDQAADDDRILQVVAKCPHLK